MKLVITSIVFACVLAGCVTPEQRAANQAARAKAIEEYDATIPICSNDDECEKQWDAAQLWVVNNAHYKIQTVTNVLIETFNSSDTGIAARVTKEPDGNGKNRIIVLISCDNPFGCRTNPQKAALDFNRTVRNATI